MKLSVVMAVRNNALTLKKAVNSILNQTFKDFEFIIVNDASTDGSLNILNNFKDKRIKLISNRQQLGLTKSLNKALTKSKGKYIARMDADDLSLKTRFQKQIIFLDSHSQIDLLGTAAHLINQKGEIIGLKSYPIDHLHLKKIALQYCPFIHPTWMFRRSVLNSLGLYNEKFLFAQDYEFILRLLVKHQAANLPQPLLQYRVNSKAAISIKNLKSQEKMALKARFMALTKYHYPLSESWKLIKPLLSFFIPAFIKLPIYKRFYWQ